MWRSLVAHLAGGQGVAGSSPVIPTIVRNKQSRLLLMSVIFVYVTCKDIKEARKIAGFCVEERLVSCGNIIPQMESFYWWDGQVNHEPESILIMKTREDLYDKVEKAVKNLHSYECPCIVALPIIKGFAPFLHWIDEETKPK